MVSPSMNSCEHTLNTLRYAHRVKELGASDPAKSSPVGGATSEEGGMTSEDSDLAKIRSMNKGELSADWYNFQVRGKKSTCTVESFSSPKYRCLSTGNSQSLGSVRRRPRRKGLKK